jgi:hypothetical protein
MSHINSPKLTSTIITYHKYDSLSQDKLQNMITQLAQNKSWIHQCNDSQQNYFDALNEIRQKIKLEYKQNPFGYYDYLIMYEDTLYDTELPFKTIMCPLKRQYSGKVVTLRCGHQYSFDGFIAYLKTFPYKKTKHCIVCRQPFSWINYLK